MRARFSLLVVAVAVVLHGSPIGGTRDAAPAPSPEAFFGFAMGAEGRLADWTRMAEYFRVLARSTRRVRVEELGKTTQGRPYLLVTIASPETLASLADIRSMQQRLADPLHTSEHDAMQIAEHGKAVIVIGGGVHSTETGSSQVMPELAWRLATGQSPEIEYLLRNLVILLVPSENPDGLQMVADWHAANRGTSYEDAALPELYHPYTGHDNNRDGFMLTQAESRHLAKLLYRDWLPEVYLDLHQMGPSRARIFVPPYRNPANANIDPSVWSESNLLGQTMATRVQEAGKTGVLWGETYTGYWQGANSTTPWWHNMVGLLSEVASARLSGTISQDTAAPMPGSLAQPAKGVTTPWQLPPPSDVQYRMNYPDPWLGGRWTPRDVIDYHMLAALGALEGTANNRRLLKRNFYGMNRRTIERFAAGRPFAFVIPPQQRDIAATSELVRLLQAGGVQVMRATQPITAGRDLVDAGSYVVPLSQSFGRWAKDLLEPQLYPDVRWPSPAVPADRPYDVTAWSLGLQMGVEVEQVDEPFTGPLVPVTTADLPRGTLTGDGGVFVIRRESDAAATLANRLLAAGGELAQLTAAARVGGTYVPAGTLLARRVAPAAVARAVASLPLPVTAVREWPESDLAPLTAPRVAVIEPWGGLIDAGWTRWVLEQHEFPYERVRPAAVRGPALAARFDAIVIPEMPSLQLMRGLTGAGVRPEHRGGLDDAGVAALRTFIDTGGTVITLGNAAEFAIDYLDAPLIVAARADDPEIGFVPGTLLRVAISAHPIAAGMPSTAAAMNVFNNAYAPARGAHGLREIARYPDEPLVLSGYATGEGRLRGHLAAVEVPMGRGRIVVLGFRVQHRAQTWSTFKLLFGALFESSTRRAPAAAPTQMQ